VIDLVHALKAYTGSRGITPFILKVDAKWRTSRPDSLISGNVTRYLLDWSFSGAQSRCEYFW